MPRRSKTWPKCKKRFATHGNMKRHQKMVFACGKQFVKQREELAKQKKAYRNRYDYLKRLGRLHEYQGPLPPFDGPTPTQTPPPRRSTRRSTTAVESLGTAPSIIGPIIVHVHYYMDWRAVDAFYD
ncbi:hypothetical protein PHYSODRAFT_331935 [Phytophthora sojae]|uniref:Uncharacterized protein n=1 Tax=Phytophthora sojae (strain P6497) TaxID=1094619 RepID=G4ZHI9_PHYSP|nr:hypothetical protein PHYSODRAFT_331935 [Phytophthora sojae]EGZ18069.1 hypothetical protein PHYSODRAFT_331935 [Phytophthora sojae]|eukprot:XP_009527127.1 hypothetical protein PHYSODRAFT_331935 [Phytophthora sojae]